jgi:CBS domain-containing protein
MFCRNALVPKVITAGPEQTIGDALGLLEKHGIRAVPIVDAAGKLVGQFNFDVVLSNLLPGPITVEAHGLMDANLRLDYLVDAEDHVARKLGELLPVKLNEVMDQEVHVVHPDTPLWEGIRQLFQHGSPIAVVDEETGKLLGLLSVQSVMGELAKLVSAGT